MYRGRGRGGRGRGGHQGARGPRIPRRKQYFETDATSASAVVLRPIPAEIRWKFIQNRPGPGEKDYTRYDLKLDEERRIDRGVPRRHDNLEDIRHILVAKLREAFVKASEYNLDCQARLGRLVWLGDLIQRGERVRRGMILSQFEGPPKYEDGKLRLKNEYFTRAAVKDTIMSRLESDYGPHDRPHFCLQIRIRDDRPEGKECIAVVSKDPETQRFRLERLSNPEGILGEFSADIVCLGSFHDLRISTKCFSVSQPVPTCNITQIIESIQLSDDGELRMILKSGPMQVKMIRHREKFVFHRGGDDWLIKFTKITEQPIRRGYCYQDKVMVIPDAGYDNAELDVILKRTLQRGADIEGVVEEILRLIGFSLQIVEVSERNLDEQ